MGGIVLALIFGAIVGLLTGVFQWSIGELAGIELPTFFVDLTSIAGVDLGTINAIIPLAEGVVLGYALLAVFFIVNIIRWVKSFVPFMAG